MRTIAKTAAAALVSMALIVPAFAQSSSSSSSSSVSAGSVSSVDLACMSVAVETRETATINARTTFNASMMTALSNRRAALKAAFLITNNADRQAAIDAALKAYATASAAARAKLKTDVNAAWSAFATASANCHITVDQLTPRKVRGEHDDDNDRHDRGLHLGWLKLKQGVKAKGWMSGSAQVDLK